MTSEEAGQPSTKVMTIPNLISFARLALLPFFLWTFVTGRDWPALIILFVIGNSDWIDGFVARRIGQVSELGKVLDPVSDRITVVAVMLALALRGVVPLWLAAAILGRELVIAIAFAILESRGVERIAVNRVGKTATMSIFLGMGFAVISLVTPVAEDLIWNISMGFLVLGAVLYWMAAFLYLNEARRLTTRTVG